MQPFTSDSVLTTPSPSTPDSVSAIPSPSKKPPSAEKGIVYIITCKSCDQSFSIQYFVCSTASGCNQTGAEHSTNSAMIAVSAVSLLLNITLATVILIQCLLVLRRKKPKDVLHSTNDETYAEPTKQVDVSTAHNEAYGLHKITKPSEEDTTYEMVK